MKERNEKIMLDKPVPMFTAKCLTIREERGFRLTFFCEICGIGYTTQLILCDTLKDALRLGEQDARLHFNRCQCCYRWVCDDHFNENRMMCTDCVPRICSICGFHVPKGDQFCMFCGAPQFEINNERGYECE